MSVNFLIPLRHATLVALALTSVVLFASEAKDDAPSAPPLVLLTTAEMPPYSYRDEETGEIVGSQAKAFIADFDAIAREVQEQGALEDDQALDLAQRFFEAAAKAYTLAAMA